MSLLAAASLRCTPSKRFASCACEREKKKERRTSLCEGCGFDSILLFHFWERPICSDPVGKIVVLDAGASAPVEKPLLSKDVRCRNIFFFIYLF
jgi:hypothetical protein